jgi:hypothetical protein
VQPASNNIEGSNWTTTNGNLAVENGGSVRHLIILIYWLENNYKSAQNISNRSPSISPIESRASVSLSDVRTPLAGDTGPELDDVANMSLDFGNMSFDEQPDPLDSEHRPPSPVIQEPRSGLAGDMPESEPPSTSLDIQQSRSGSPDPNEFSDLSSQAQSNTSRDQAPMPVRSPTPINDSDSADPGCQKRDDGSGQEDLRRIEATREPHDFTFDVLSELVQLDDIKKTMEFIRALQTASLDDEATRLDSECLDRLRNPPQESIDISDPDLRLALDNYLAVGNASQETYNAVRTAILRCYPENKLLSYDQIKRRVTQMSGVTSLIHDMCINGCLAFTGPFAGLEACLTCGEHVAMECK